MNEEGSFSWTFFWEAPSRLCRTARPRSIKGELLARDVRVTGLQQVRRASE